MSRRILVGVVAALAALSLLALAGCGSSGSNTTTVKKFTDKDKTITVKKGDTFTITVDSNPTTGYEWQVVTTPDGKAVKLEKSTYEAPAKQIPGAGGKQVWTFKAVSPGTATFSAKYSRSWEQNDPSAKVMTTKITVN